MTYVICKCGHDVFRHNAFACAECPCNGFVAGLSPSVVEEKQQEQKRLAEMEKQHCYHCAKSYAHKHSGVVDLDVLTELFEMERLQARVELRSEAYQGAWTDCIQDGCENCPFASIGGLEARANFQRPNRLYVKTEEQWQDWLQGYADCARYSYGKDWMTCEFGWGKALTI